MGECQAVVDLNHNFSTCQDVNHNKLYNKFTTNRSNGIWALAPSRRGP